LLFIQIKTLSRIYYKIPNSIRKHDCQVKIAGLRRWDKV
jgi:hypothetical protein